MLLYPEGSDEGSFSPSVVPHVLQVLGAVVVAYNLDGGATAVMATAEDALNQRKNEDRECSDIVYISDSAIPMQGTDEQND